MAIGAVERKARADLKTLAEGGDSAVAASYLLLARQLDEGVPARELASISREMRLCYGQLVEMSGVKKPDSKVDELRKRREDRDAANAQSQ